MLLDLWRIYYQLIVVNIKQKMNCAIQLVTVDYAKVKNYTIVKEPLSRIWKII